MEYLFEHFVLCKAPLNYCQNCQIVGTFLFSLILETIIWFNEQTKIPEVSITILCRMKHTLN